MIEKYGDSIKLVTKKEHNDYYKSLATINSSDNLGPSALEVLAIIAYNPDITRISIDEIRGVNSSYIIRKLLIKGLIKESGKAKTPGNPRMYTVTDEFLDFLGITDKDELPYVESVKLEVEDDNLFKSRYNEE